MISWWDRAGCTTCAKQSEKNLILAEVLSHQHQNNLENYIIFKVPTCQDEPVSQTQAGRAAEMDSAVTV